MALYIKALTGNCELSTGAFTPTSAVQGFTGDNEGMQVSISFFDNGVEYTIPGDVEIRAHLFYESRKIMTPSVLLDVDGNEASFLVPDTFTAVSGTPLLVVRMVNADGKSSVLCAFVVTTKAAVADNVIYLTPPSPDTIVYIGRSPYIGVNGHWFVWDNTTGGFVDSGVIGAGTNGNPGYAHIKYSTVEPTSDDDMTDTPSAYIGIYAGTSATAPTTYTSYQWYPWKGIPGNNGTSAYLHIRWGTSLTPETLLLTPDEYIGVAATNSATAPTDYTGYAWYQWKGTPGDVSTVDGVSPDEAGNVALGAVRYTAQTLTTMEQTQARANIGAASAEAMDAKASGSSPTATLPTTGWTGSGPYTYDANVMGVTADNALIVSPAPASKAAYEACKAYASAQGTGTLTFTAESVPTESITVNVVVLNL